MPRNKLTDLLEQQPSKEKAAEPGELKSARKSKVQPEAERLSRKPGAVNISAYFDAEVKAALRHVQAKTGKNIKGCLAEALQLLFRKHNVAVTVKED